MQARSDSILVVSMQKALKLQDYHITEVVNQLEQYRALLASIFDKDRHHSKMAITTLFNDEIGRYWQDTTSCLLVLSGCNEIGVRMNVQSWLSMMAVDLIQHALNK
jgi:hypothetical protein